MKDFKNLIPLLQIPAGSFSMGSPDGEGYDDEKPQYLVTVPPFQMGKYPVAQAQYEAVMGDNPSCFKGENLPVERVSWYDAVNFCERLSQLTGRLYRLPSEAEWEYACRAGTTTHYHFGDKVSEKEANFSSDSTTEVGIYPPNVFGLYDMHGNVWEWCFDHWHGNYEGAPTDGSAWVTENERVYRLVRGGSWGLDRRYCRSPSRYYYTPDSRYDDIGFRVVCAAART